jgi:hypothetical protein
MYQLMQRLGLDLHFEKKSDIHNHVLVQFRPLIIPQLPI